MNKKKSKIKLREVAVFLLALLMVLSLIVPSLLTLVDVISMNR